MDQLQYTYAANSNQLIKVKDNVTVAATGTLPDFKDKADLGVEYTYDDNGNQISDENKGITITYNYLNKPAKININGKGNISYMYDAAGNRLRKTIHDDVANTTEVWDYMGNFVYKDNVLQYILNEEGRSRPEVVTSGAQSGQTKFVYDYFIKDHLGNVRSTISAQPINQQYLAQHEIATAGSEQLIFDNIALVRDDKPGSINPGDLKAAHLIASDPHKRIGTAIMLRVMPGDKFTFGADSYYESDQTETNETPSAEDVVNSLLTTLTGGTVGGIPVTDAGENVSMINQALSNQETIDFIKTQMELQQNTNGPKAALNYLFFDQGFKLMPAISGKLGVTVTPGQFNNMSVSPTPMTEPGYVVVFVDNNSIGTDVWFDNVQVSHFNGEVLEENHYYPFGLTISQSGIGVDQPYKLTTKELEKAFDLNMYDFGARQFDMQLGRWTSIDPLAELMRRHSPYNYAFNNPVRFIDPDGMAPGDPTDYYNLKGSLVKTTEDGSSEKKYVLVESSKSEKVDEALNNGLVAPVPSNESISQMDKVYENMDQTGFEHGFVAASDGTASDIKTSESNNHVELGGAIDDLKSAGKTPYYDVHGHSNFSDKNGQIVDVGMPEPSGMKGGTPEKRGDTEVYGKIGLNQPSIVLGYEGTLHSNTTIDGKTTSYFTTAKQLSFYNANGRISPIIDYDKFKKITLKINNTVK